jgi:hypothetical protein
LNNDLFTGFSVTVVVFIAMPGETNSDKMAAHNKLYPMDPARIAAFKASNDRLMSGIVENLNNDFRDNEPAQLESNEQPNNKYRNGDEMEKHNHSDLHLGDIDKALTYAARVHSGQTRKGTVIPYITHPYAVGMILARNGCADHVVIAGILHDTVEDGIFEDGTVEGHKVTINDIDEYFGPEVAAIITGCSEDKSLGWKERKQHTIDYLASASHGVKLVTCADKLHNITSMLDDYSKCGEALWNRFNAGRSDQEWYYRSLADALSEGDFKLHKLSVYFNEAVGKLFPNSN